METGRGGERLAEARRALQAARWDAARAAFEAAIDADPTPDARDGLGLALWFLGRVEDGIATRGRPSRSTFATAGATKGPASPCGSRTNT